MYTGMTLAELDDYVEAYGQKLKSAQELLAWHAATTMQVHVKKGSNITPAKLLGKSDDRLDKSAAAKQARAERVSKKEINRDLVDDLLPKDEEYDYVAIEAEEESWAEGVLKRAEEMERDTLLEDDDE